MRTTRFKYAESKLDWIGDESLLALTPSTCLAGCVRETLRVHLFHDPVHGREHFKSEKRGLHSAGEIADMLQSIECSPIGSEKSLASETATGTNSKCLSAPAAMGISRNEVPFDHIEHVPKILCIGSVRAIKILELQRLSGLLHEVHQFVDL